MIDFMMRTDEGVFKFCGLNEKGGWLSNTLADENEARRQFSLQKNLYPDLRLYRRTTTEVLEELQ